MIGDTVSKELVRHDDKGKAHLPIVVVTVPSFNLSITQPMYAIHLAAYLSDYASPMSHLMKACNTHYQAQIGSVDIFLWRMPNLASEVKPFPSDLQPVISISGVGLENLLLQGQDYWKKRLTMVHSKTKVTVYQLSAEMTTQQLELMAHISDSWINFISDRENCTSTEILDVCQSTRLFFDGNDSKLHINLSNISGENYHSFANMSMCGSLKSFDMFWQSSSVDIIPLFHCSHLSDSIHSPEKFLQPSGFGQDLKNSADHLPMWDDTTHCITFFAQIPFVANSCGCILMHIHSLFINIDPHTLDIISQLPSFPLDSLLPSLQFSGANEGDVSVGKSSFFDKLHHGYAIQIVSEGGQLLFLQNSHPCSQNDYRAMPAINAVQKSILQSQSSALCVSFPKLTANTGGFKLVQISPKLLSTGVQVNKFTEFSRLNFGLENASAYTILSNQQSALVGDYILEPCAAACTIVFKESKNLKINVALHVDLDSISVELSKSKIALLVEVLNSILRASYSVHLNWTSKGTSSVNEYDAQITSKSKLDDATESKITSDLQNEKTDLNSSLSTLPQPASARRKLPFTLWMQCTLPRFTFSIMCENASKVVFYVDDVSMSLDCQAVYLKLMMSLSTCNISQWRKKGGDYIKCTGVGLMFSPMFTVLPSFLQQLCSPKHAVDVNEAELSAKPGKFIDLTFTQALASDYRQNLLDGSESVDQTNSSVVTAASETLASANNDIQELICIIQGFDVLLCPEQLAYLGEVFLPLLRIQTSEVAREISSQDVIALPRLYVTVTGTRLFFPSAKSKKLSDDMLLLCFGNLEINPQPQNLLSRLVISPSIFKRASSAGLLSCPGSSLEDRQFEVILRDLSMGTAKCGDVIAYLEKPAIYSENPALQWNLLERNQLVKPVYHPIVEQFDTKVTLAPSIYYTSASGKRKMVCGPSLELNITSDLVIHITSMQGLVLLELSSQWSKQHDRLFDLMMEFESQEVFPQAADGDKKERVGVNRPSEKMVKAGSSQLISDNLITGQKIQIVYYQFSEDNLITPLLQLRLDEPSFVFHVSKRQQKLVMQVHNAVVNICESDKRRVETIHDQENFSIPFLQTLPGKCNERTGVPMSLCTLNVDHFLTTKANLKLWLGRPLKVTINESPVILLDKAMEDLSSLLNFSNSSSERTESCSVFQKFALVSFHSSQIVGEIDCSSHILRCCISEIDLHIDTNRDIVQGNATLSGISARIQRKGHNYAPLLYPVDIQASLKCYLLDPGSVLFVKLKLTSVHCAVTPEAINGILALVDTIYRLNDRFHASANAKKVTIEGSTGLPRSCIVKPDDLRQGNYTYLSTVKKHLEPLCGQIVFSSELPVSTMSWCYDKPHTVRRVCITPIPFNEILGDGSDILCSLESYDECSDVYECRKKFYVSETKHIEFLLHNENTPFHEMFFSTKWRVSVHNTDKCHVSPLSLAASMNVEVLHDSSLIPNIVSTIEVPAINVTFTTKDQKYENVQVNISKLHLRMKVYDNINKAAKAEASMAMALQTMEYHNLTWIPVVLPLRVHVELMQLNTSIDIAGRIPLTTEIHISQHALYSLQCLASLFSSSNQNNSNPILLQLQNHTSKTILFGQALTDECMRLPSGETQSYSWRTNRIEPMLHVSVEGLSHCNWSPAFSPYAQRTVLCAINDSSTVVAKVNQVSPHQSTISFHGCTKIVNHLDVNLTACLTISGETSYINCSSGVPQQEYVFALKDVSTMLFKLAGTNCTASEAVFPSELLLSPDAAKFIHLTSDDGQTVHAQICHIKENLVDVIAIMPFFIIRSYLPNAIILHVETRGDQLSENIQLQGCGKQILLKSLSPFATHHLTVQLNESESPFDATIPMHFSLRGSLNVNADVDEKPENLVKHYPFTSLDYDGRVDENWTCGDGSIQAKLSLHSKSLLVELVPWCLVRNDTTMVFCITSSNNCVSIIQPEQTMTLHHFTGMFNIRSHNSDCSEFLTLNINPELDHPSRADKLKLNHLPYNGFRAVVLKTNINLVEVILRSTVHHGVRVVIITPRWKFVSMVSETSRMHVLPCAAQNLMDFNHKDCVHEAETKSILPLLSWRTEIEQESAIAGNKPDNDGETVSVESVVEKTTSSFLCVEKVSLTSAYEDRLVWFKTQDLRAVVSVKEGFTKQIVNFYSSTDHVLKKQLIVTKHEHHGCFYIVLSDIQHQKYTLRNHTDLTLHVQELTDNPSSTVVFVIKPDRFAKFESSLDAELFPMCLRKHHSVRFQIRETDNDAWTEFLICAKESKEEVLVSGSKRLEISVSLADGKVFIDFRDTPQAVCNPGISSAFSFKFSIKELKLVLFDDLSSPQHSIDVVQLIFDDIDVGFSFVESKWRAKLCILKYQIDNHLYAESDFPVFLSSSSEDKKCLSFCVILHDNFLLDSIEVAAETIEVQSESDFLQALSRLLQLYLSSSHMQETNVAATQGLPEAVEKELKVLVNPLRFQSIVIHPVTVMLSIRASLALSVSVDRGAVTFSKFVCRDVDTTFHEIVQELTRHFFAEAVYGAGWVIGSVDLLGNPASTIRSYVKGISDFVVMPYQGIINGPTAFFGGFTRGVASLLRHFSAGTLRSVTNFASGISRNFNYSSYEQRHPAPTLPLLLKTSPTYEGSGDSTGREIAQKSETNFVSGVTKALVGVVTKPIGGAAGLVSRTGESILRKAGLEEHKSARYGSESHFTSSYKNSLTKYTSKVVAEKSLNPLEMISLDCKIICLNGVSFSATLILSPTTFYIVQLVDDVLETSIPILDIDLYIEKIPSQDTFLLTVLNKGPVVSDDKNSTYSEKVASYLGVNSASSTSKIDHVKYSAELDQESNADLFLAYFKLVKNTASKFEW